MPHTVLMESIKSIDRRRVQTLVAVEKARRYKAAAALQGKTLEEWLEAAADEKLGREAGDPKDTA